MDSTEHRGPPRRPALLVAGGLVAGLVVGIYAPFPVHVLAVAACAAGAVAVAVRQRGPSTFCALAALAAGAAAWYAARAGFDSPRSLAFTLPPDYSSRAVDLTGVVVSDPVAYEEGVVFDLAARKLRRGGGELPVAGKVRVTAPVEVRYGEEVELRGMISRPRPARNPGDFDRRAYLARRGVIAVMRVADASAATKSGVAGGNPLMVFSYAAKRRAAAALDEAVGGEEARLLKGLVLGTREELDPAVMEDFRAAGVVHIIAISGFNVGLIGFALFMVLRGTRLPRSAADVVVMAFLPAYAVLTGLDPPVVRAAIMGGLVLLGDILERDVDIFNSLAVAVVAILVANPAMICDASFQLSFSATASLALFYPVFRKVLGGRPRWLTDTAAGTFAAQLGVLPLQLYYFHRFTPTAFLSNLIMIPLSSLAISAALLTVVAGSIWNAAGQVYGAAAWLAARGLIWGGHLFSLGLKPFWEEGSAPSWADLQFWTPASAAWLAAAGVAVLFAIRFPGRRVRAAAVVGAAGCLAIWGATTPPRRGDLLRVTFLDVGQADASVIEFPNGSTMVVDAGYGGRGYDAGARVIGPFLRRRGITHIDYLCISHGDADHCGGAPYLIKTFPVRHVWYSSGGGRGEAWPALLAAASAVRAEGGPLPPSTLAVGEVRMERLWPPDAPDPALSSNNRSTALRLTYGYFAGVWTGDLEREGQRRLLATAAAVRADVLKVPHHGARDAADAAFVAAVNPRVAYVTGKPDSERYPATETRALYERAETTFLNAGNHGALTIETDGRRLRAKTMF